MDKNDALKIFKEAATVFWLASMNLLRCQICERFMLALPWQVRDGLRRDPVAVMFAAGFGVMLGCVSMLGVLAGSATIAARLVA